MWKPVVITVLCLCSLTYAVPLGLKKNMAIVQEEEPMIMMATDKETRPEMMISRLNLPSNATSIRADITDGFSCDNKTYGYYADVENECQIFHVCLPVTYADGKENTFRWSFICPEETVFSQDSFTCMRPEDMSIDCEESFKYYELNRNFGMIESEDSPSQVVDEEMNMEELSRQPGSQELEQEKKPMAVAAPVRREQVKVQSSNRRKTQANRATLESQRRKVQPLRKIPQAVEPAPTTAKPVEEDAPVFEQEAERTTVKYNRFTKRPTSIVKEQPKPEPSKPEQQLLRQDLFSQKRKRPQIFTATNIEAAAQTEEGTPKKPETVESEIISHDQAEAQASEIAEVSIKPRDEEIRVEAMPMEVVKMESLKKSEPAFVKISVQEEIAPMPENTPSRVEIVEIPIQKVDEPVVVEDPAPIVEKPMANVIELEPAIKEEVEKLINEELLAEQTMQSELTKSFEEEQGEPDQVMEADIPAEVENPEEAENDALEAIPEIEQMLEAVKAVEQPIEEVPASEPEKTLPTIAETEIPAAESVMDSETSVETEVPAIAPLKAFETMVEPEVQASETSNAMETMVEPAIAAAVHEIAETLKSPEPEMPVKIEAEPESDKTNEDEKAISVADVKPEALVEAEKSIPEPEIAGVETPVAGSEKPIEVEVPAQAPEIPLKVESAVPEMPIVVEAPVPEVPLVVELPMPEMPMQIEAEPQPQSIKPLETEVPTVNMEMTKIAEIQPALVETPMKLVEKPLEVEVPAEPVIVLNGESQIPVESEPIAQLSGESQFSIESEQSEAQLEKSSEVQSEAESPQTPEEMEAVPQAIAAADTQSSAAEPEIDTQTLILDFISSLVNSENSNLGEQAKPNGEIPSESIPEPVAVKAEEQSAEIQEKPAEPMYIPIIQNNEHSYQIPVQIIETPEPEAPIPVPVAAEPKLPLTVDDVVELVKESLDTPAEKENFIQEPLADQAKPETEPQSDSEEIKPIYQRYFELGSNLLKSEALTASDEDEPTVVAAANDDSKAEEPMPASEQLASEPEPALSSVPQTDALPVEALSADSGTDDRLTMSRSMNRFRMDPRKRRFLFRSDAS